VKTCCLTRLLIYHETYNVCVVSLVSNRWVYEDGDPPRQRAHYVEVHVSGLATPNPAGTASSHANPPMKEQDHEGKRYANDWRAMNA